MTKKEHQQFGREAGAGRFARLKLDAENRLSAEAPLLFTPAATREQAREQAAWEADSHMRTTGHKAVAYREAFVNGFVAAWDDHHEELPEVKAEWKLRRFNYRLDSTVESADRTLAEFSENFGKNAGYTLTWADSTFAAAASREVAMQLRTIAFGSDTVEAKGVDAAIAYASRKALEGARYGTNRSTSACSNIYSDHMTRAWAEFAEISF